MRRIGCRHRHWRFRRRCGGIHQILQFFAGFEIGNTLGWNFDAGACLGIASNARQAVDTAFLDGMQVGSLVSAGMAAVAAVIVAWMLPARARQTAPTAAEIELPEQEEICA